MDVLQNNVFLSLPIEIHWQIQKSLSWEDCLQLRICCRHLLNVVDVQKAANKSKMFLRINHSNFSDVLAGVKAGTPATLFRNVSIHYCLPSLEIVELLRLIGTEIHCIFLSGAEVLNATVAPFLPNLSSLRTEDEYDFDESTFDLNWFPRLTEMEVVEQDWICSRLADEHIKIRLTKFCVSAITFDQFAAACDVIYRHRETLECLRFTSYMPVTIYMTPNVLKTFRSLFKLRELHVSAPGCGFDVLLNNMPAETPIEILSLSFKWASHQPLSLTTKWSNTLRELTLHDFESFEAFQPIRSNFRSLSLNSCDLKTSSIFIYSLARNPNAHESLQHLKLVRQIDLTETDIMLMAVNLHGLKSFYIEDCPNAVTDGAVQTVIHHLRKLEELSVENGNLVTDAGLSSLSQLQGLRKLNIVGLNKLTDTTLSSALRLPILSRLRFGLQDKFSAAGFSQLALHCPGLEYVRIFCCSQFVDDVALQFIRNLSRLRRLQIRACPVSPRIMDLPFVKS